MRDSFVFYRSFVEAADELNAEDFKTLITAICKYALDGEEPEITGIPKMLFTVARPILESNNKRYENGKKGGRPSTKNHRLSESETIGYAETKPNVNVNDNVNVNVNVNKRARANQKKNKFNQFDQRVYDYAELEKRLMAR